MSNIWGKLEPHHLGQGSVANAPRTCYYPTSYHTKFCHFRSNFLDVYRGPKNLGMLGSHPLGMGHGCYPRNTHLPNLCYRIKFGRTSSNCFGIIIEICQKILTPCIPPFKVTQGHWNHHLLVFHCNFSPISYHFQDK